MTLARYNGPQLGELRVNVLAVLRVDLVRPESSQGLQANGCSVRQVFQVFGPNLVQHLAEGQRQKEGST